MDIKMVVSRHSLERVAYTAVFCLAMTGAGCHRRTAQTLPPPETLQAATCTAQPLAVDAGAPVQILVTPSGFSPKRTLTYSFTSTGGAVGAIGAGATVDTTGLQPGSYTVTAAVTDNGRGSHQRQAMCQASFSVNAIQPPTLAVSADPDFVSPGESSAITADGKSPDNQPLAYECSSTDGSLSGSGQHYTLDTTGVQGRAITVSCTVTDDRNQSASASTEVSVVPLVGAEAPALAPAPEANQFGEIEFKNDRRHPTRVDIEAKGELDRYADVLAAHPNSAAGVVVGYQLNSEPSSYAAQRGVNTKDYLTREKGIDPSRIEVRIGSGQDQRSDLWIVPAGATFFEEGTALVNESTIQASPPLPLSRSSSSPPIHKGAKTAKALAESFSQYINRKVAAAKQGRMDLNPPSSAVFAGNTFLVTAVISRLAAGQNMTFPIGGTPGVTAPLGATGQHGVSQSPGGQVSASLKVDDEMRVTLKSETPETCTAPKDDSASQQDDIRLPATGGTAEWQWDVKALNSGKCVLKAFAYMVYCNPEVADCNQKPDRVQVLSKSVTVVIGVAQKPSWYVRLTTAITSAIETHWIAILVSFLPPGGIYAIFCAWRSKVRKKDKKVRANNDLSE